MVAPATTAAIYLPTSTTITQAINVSIQRGRSSPVFDDIDAGRATVMMNNEDRRFDPLYASSPIFGNVVPGRRCTIVSGGVTIMDATVRDWGFDYDVSGRSVAVAQLEDGLGKLGRATFDEWTTTRGQQPGARLASVIARPEVGYTGSTSFDTGSFYLQDDFVSWGSNVLNYCQLVARTDQGLFFVDRSGVLQFVDRLALINTSPTVTLGTGGVGFSAISPSYGTELLFNRASVEREGGEPQTVSDATSITAYDGTYSINLTGLLMEDDDAADDLATRLVAVYKDPLYRVESVTIDVHGLTSGNQTSVLGLDIGSLVTVTWTPNRVGTAISRTCIVEGVRHQIQPRFHTMELTLNDSTTSQTGQFWTVGDATYGTVSAGGALSYPVAF